MKKRCTFLLMNDQQVGQKDLNEAPSVGEKETVKGKSYEVISVSSVEKNEYTIRVKPA